MTWALIKDGKVVNVILASAEFISTISGQYQACIDITNSDPCPHIGWVFDGSTLTDPNPPVVVEPPAPEVPQ